MPLKLRSGFPRRKCKFPKAAAEAGSFGLYSSLESRGVTRPTQAWDGSPTGCHNPAGRYNGIPRPLICVSGGRRETEKVIAREDGYTYIAALRSPDLRHTTKREGDTSVTVVTSNNCGVSVLIVSLGLVNVQVPQDMSSALIFYEQTFCAGVFWTDVAHEVVFTSNITGGQNVSRGVLYYLRLSLPTFLLVVPVGALSTDPETSWHVFTYISKLSRMAAVHLLLVEPVLIFLCLYVMIITLERRSGTDFAIVLVLVQGVYIAYRRGGMPTTRPSSRPSSPVSCSSARTRGTCCGREMTLRATVCVFVYSSQRITKINTFAPRAQASWSEQRHVLRTQHEQALLSGKVPSRRFKLSRGKRSCPGSTKVWVGAQQSGVRVARCSGTRVRARAFDRASFDAHAGPLWCSCAVPRSSDGSTVAAHEESTAASAAGKYSVFSNVYPW